MRHIIIPFEGSEKSLEDEKKLIKQSISGDIQSFETLINRYQKMAYNVAYRILGNEEDAKDMTQEALIKVFRNLKSFRMDSSFSTWLYRIVMNTCKDHLRKNKVKVISMDQSYDVGDGEVQMEFEDQGLKPDEVLVSKETQSEVQEALMVVSEKNRIVVVLRDIKGFSYSEISDIVNIPIGTIKSRISRGRQELKTILLSKRQSVV